MSDEPSTKRDAKAVNPNEAATEGGDRERGDRGPAAEEASVRSHELSAGELGPTEDYGDG